MILQSELSNLRMAAQMELKVMKEHNPGRFFVPNKAQERALENYRECNGTELGVPYINVFGGGNGVGKTTALVIMLLGLAYGRSELNRQYYGEHYVFKMMEERCKKRVVNLRVICHSEGMKEDGPVYKEIRKWFPEGRYQLLKGGKTYYSIMRCMSVTGKIVAEIGFKSHDQDKIAHAGTTLDAILCDEPMPQELYGEMIGRTRNGGFISFFLTPLEMSAWMDKQILKQIDGRVRTLTNGSLWENCKDIPGMRGHLGREQIENMISEWKRMAPGEVEARVNGTFSHLSGVIYKVYNEGVHLVPAFDIPKDWPIYHIIDPHDSRPPAMVWIAQSPVRDYVIAEWPTDDYTQMTTTTLNINHFCEEIRRTEMRLGRIATHRYCDPNKLNYEYPNTRLTVGAEYSKRGYSFLPSDDNLEIGHQRVNEALYYDESRALSEWNMPRLQVFDYCKNTNDALKGYGFKKGKREGNLSSRLDQTFKDFADTIRYYIVKKKAFAPVMGNGGDRFVDELKAGRVK